MREDGNQPATKADLRNVGFRLDSHDENLRRLNISCARLESDMAWVKGTLKTVASNVEILSTNVERMSGNIETALRKMDMQGSMLMDHEGRITKLEPRPS